MRPFPTRLVTTLCLGLALAAPVAGQDQPLPQKIPCVVFPVQSIAGDDGTADYEKTITESVSAALSVGALTLLGPESWSGDAARRTVDRRALLEPSEAIGAARAAGAAVAVTGYYTLRDQKIAVFLQCWDVKTGRLLASLQQAARFNLAFYSVLHGRIAEILPLISVTQPTVTGIAAEPGRFALAEIDFFSSDEGMEIVVDGDRSIGTVSGGKLVWKNPGLSPGEELFVEKRKEGFHGSTERLKAAQQVRLSPLLRKSGLGGDFFLGSAQLLGLGAQVRAYMQPGWSFFYAGAYPFWQVPAGASGHFVTHVETGLGLGSYIGTPPDWPVRFGLSTGVGMIVTPPFADAGSTYTDAYLDVFNWWVETRVLGPLIFLRQEWKYALGLGTNLLGMGWIMTNDFPLVTIGVSFPW